MHNQSPNNRAGSLDTGSSPTQPPYSPLTPNIATYSPTQPPFSLLTPQVVSQRVTYSPTQPPFSQLTPNNIQQVAYLPTQPPFSQLTPQIIPPALIPQPQVSLPSNANQQRNIPSILRRPALSVVHAVPLITRSDGGQHLADRVAGPSMSQVQSQLSRSQELARMRVRRYREQMDDLERAAYVERGRQQRMMRAAQQSEEERAASQDRRREHQASLRASANEESRDVRRELERDRHHVREMRLNWNLEYAGLNYNHEIDYHSHLTFLIGALNIVCKFCGALKFKDETDAFCCRNGKIKLNPVEGYPVAEFESLFNGTTDLSKHFLSNIRYYNNCFSMTSFGAHRGTISSTWSTFKFNGIVHHYIGSMLPPPDETPKFLQVYFMSDRDVQIDHRTNLFQGLRRDVVSILQIFLERHNALIDLYKIALSRMPNDNCALRIVDGAPPGDHPGRYNLPTERNMAIIMVQPEPPTSRRNNLRDDASSDTYSRRDIIIQRRRSLPDGRPMLERVWETHPLYDALQYPLIYWRGSYTYDFNTLRQFNPVTGQNLTTKITLMEYYRHQFMVRLNCANILSKCRSLMQMFATDCYAKMEADRLRFLRLNQSKLRRDDLVHLQDAIANNESVDDIGRRVILPSSYVGGPRHMYEYAQDGMAFVKKHGRPDLFITVTCDPNWPEIRDNLFEGQSPNDRHDLIARVFHLRIKNQMTAIEKGRLFGRVKCYMYTIEWQKRGLPHAHILIWLEDKVRPEMIDQVVSAELPDESTDPELFDLVSKHMIHGPCGRSINEKSPCLDSNHVCKKQFPKAFHSETQSGQDGYPLYRRRSVENGGREFTITRGEMSGRRVDNRWVVPYNPTLLKINQSHTNVEVCNSVKSIKYICKYINKGSDMTRVEIESENENDEIKRYQIARYISTNESFWRMFGFEMHHRQPNVVRLFVHLENGQQVTFSQRNAQEIAQNPPSTTLTAFFDLCSKDEFARTLIYPEVPTYYTWKLGSGSVKGFWQRRKRSRKVQPVPGWPDVYASNAISRVYTVAPSRSECFHLRILLHFVRGPTSFDDLKCVDSSQAGLPSTMCSTYRDACRRLGLLENDNHWESALREAADTKRPAGLRMLFAVILTKCSPANPLRLWELFKNDLSEDLIRNQQLIRENFHTQEYEECYNAALVRLEDICLQIENKLLYQLDMPSPNRDFIDAMDAEITRERDYNRVELARFVSETVPKLLPEQKVIYEQIIEAIELENGKGFIIDAPGGTGKTFLLNLISAKIRSTDKIIKVVASSGIAATLLTGGRTAHSTFKIPIRLFDPEPLCGITRQSALGRVLRECVAIIWDECTMVNNKALEAVDRSLRDIRQNDSRPFGGIVVILAGDFRQTLPVVKGGTRADEIAACLKRCTLWHHFEKIQLRTNMRVQLRGELEAQYFADQLLSIGEGRYRISKLPHWVKLDQNICKVVATEEELITKVFPNLVQDYMRSNYFSDRAILAPTNDDINALNKKILSHVPGREKTYYSYDVALSDEQAVQFPPEVLNSLNPSNFPPHKLTLKVGVPIMIVRNLNPPLMVNGTRLSVKNMHRNLIEAVISSGTHAGEVVFIPRIPLIDEDSFIPFKRTQFPVRLAFALTINKSQGQSLNVAGLHFWSSHCFSHGQLYVACSRVGSPSSLFVLAKDGVTANVVYPQALM